MTDALVLSGRGRVLGPGGATGPALVSLDADGLTLGLDGTTRVAAYRDLATIAVQDGAALLVLGDGTGAVRIVLDQFGSAQGQLVRELRERRLRQRAGDAFISLSADEPIALVEYEDGTDHGVGQLAYHAWGVLLAPLDERRPWIRVRRSRIVGVRLDAAAGSVSIERPGDSVMRLVGLGSAARLHGDRCTGLRSAAAADAARIIGRLIPDASYAARAEASGILVDGDPATEAELAGSWAALEAGVLVDPTFAGSYAQLRTTAGSLAGSRSIAIAPVEPGGEEGRTWFLVPLPGNLVALELVSEGAHATYCFRTQPRASFVEGVLDPAVIRATVGAISEALVDSRFLREPMALSDEVLAAPRFLRYRLALSALPSLAAARARFVARIVHRDDASWSAALADLIAWHAGVRDDAAIWPGRAAQDSIVDDVPNEVRGAS